MATTPRGQVQTQGSVPNANTGSGASGTVTGVERLKLQSLAAIYTIGSGLTLVGNALSAALANATTSVAGLMSAADKTKLDGIQSYASGIVSLNGGGATTSFAHGLGARPRFVGGYYGAVNNDANLVNPITPDGTGLGTAGVEIYNVDATNIYVQNNVGSARYIKVFAQL